MPTGSAIYEGEKIIGHQAPMEKQESFISWEDFQTEYLTREDDFKYEWLNGTIEKTSNTMERAQFIILKNLQDYFYQLKFERKIKGNLITEGDLFFQAHHRRPDVCWLTDKQLDSLSENNKDVPAFVIEIISTNDMINKVATKMEDYRAAHVQVVWHIFPSLKQVHIYTGKKLGKMEVCMDDYICSAAPVLPDFQISIPDLFKKAVPE